MTTALGEKIYKLRKQENLTLEQLADRTASSKSYIWELENKNPPRPSAEKIFKIAEQLGVTIEYLINEGELLTEADATDQNFYRKYKKKTPEVKKKIRKMVDLWEDE